MIGWEKERGQRLFQNILASAARLMELLSTEMGVMIGVPHMGGYGTKF